MTSNATSPRHATLITGASVAAMMVLAVGVSLELMRCSGHRADNADGQPMRAWIEDGTLRLHDHVSPPDDDSAARDRLETYDLRTGQRLARTIVDSDDLPAWAAGTIGHDTGVTDIAVAGMTLHVPDSSTIRITTRDAEAPPGTVTVDATLTPLWFMRDAATGQPIVLDANSDHSGAVLARYVDVPTDKRSRVHGHLARVDRNATVVWSTDVGGSVQLVTVAGDLIVVATDWASHRALGLDAATGTVRWRLTR